MHWNPDKVNFTDKLATIATVYQSSSVVNANVVMQKKTFWGGGVVHRSGKVIQVEPFLPYQMRPPLFPSPLPLPT